MAVIDVQRQLLSLCFDEIPSEEVLAELGQREVWLTYREMIRDRIWRELRLALPRTCALVGDDALSAAFAFHLADEPPRTRYFRELVGAFVASALPFWAADAELHPACCDMARYELALWEVRDLEQPELSGVSEFSFEGVAVVSKALRLLVVSHAVHQEGLSPHEHYLCIQRVAEAERPKVWSLTRTTFRLLDKLACEDVSASEAIRQVARTSGASIDAAYLDALCATLAQFLEVGIILGSR